MGWLRGKKPPKSLHWKDVHRVLMEMGAVYLGKGAKGSHRKYERETAKKRFAIVVPEKDDIPKGTIDSIIRQAGVTPKYFWSVHFDGMKKQKAPGKPKTQNMT